MTGLSTPLRQSAAVLLVAVLATGCAELRWHKDGIEAAALEQDLAACRQSARLRAYREAWLFGVTPPYFIGMDPQGRSIMTYPNQLEMDRFLLEHDLMRDCMRGKGYQHVPVEKR